MFKTPNWEQSLSGISEPDPIQNHPEILDRKKALGGPERGTRCHSQTKQQLTLNAGFLCQAQLRASYRSWPDLILTTSPWADAVMTPCFARQGNKSLVLKYIYMISHESQMWL